jgi:hypothetical protein
MKKTGKVASAILGVGLLAIISVMVSPRTAHALVATLVQVVNPPSQPVLTGEVIQPYQQFADVDCSNLGACSLAFPTVTQETLILHASCSFELPSSASVGFASLMTQNDNPRNFLPPFTGGIFGPNTFYEINAETYLYVAAGDSPQIEVFSSSAAVSSLLCTVSGKNVIHN